MPDGPKRPAKVRHKPNPNKLDHSTNETHGYLSGLYEDFNEQVTKYVQLVHMMLSAQARVELAEKNLCNTREHFAAHIIKCKDAVPGDWSVTLARARFVGARLSEACKELLVEHRKLTPVQLLAFLNNGQYRWRTPTPFREIHGALVKQSWAKREGDDYVWVGPDPQLQLADMRLTGLVVLSENEREGSEKKAS
jgi:hypothetical protein